MIVTPIRPIGRKWNTLSFATTLYLLPILDVLLAEVPPDYHAEIRLGLQEALVNAVKHGNKLDPSKQVTVHFAIEEQTYWWIIADQGGMNSETLCQNDDTPCEQLECGRGFYILRRIFDVVNWDWDQHHLQLGKRIDHGDPRQQPLVS